MAALAMNNGYRLESMQSSGMRHLYQPLKVQSGKRSLVIRYYDGSTVQCEDTFLVDLKQGESYKVHLEMQPGRKFIKLSIKNNKDQTLIAPPALAGQIKNGLNIPGDFPIPAELTRNETGCY